MGVCSICWAAGVCAVAVLYRYSTAVRYYLKYIIFIAHSAILTTVSIPLMIPRPGDSKNGSFTAWGLRKLSKAYGLKWELTGRENIVQGSGSVVLFNHQSILDIMVLAEVWPIMEQCTVVAKRQVLYLGPFGLAAYLTGTIFIDKLNPGRAKQTVNMTGEIVRKRRAQLLMCPEGTRHGGEELLPFKKGAFHVALDSQLPIQPVVVSRYTFLDHKRKIFDSGHIQIKILPAIPTEGYTRNDLEKLIEKTYNVMQEHYTKLNVEMRQRYQKTSEMSRL